MGNLTGSTPNLDSVIADNETYGEYRRFLFSRNAATSGATTASGGVTTIRYPQTLTIPSVGTGIAGYVFTKIQVLSEDGTTGGFVGLEYDLGSLAISGNVFTSGVTMPTKTINGVSKTTAASLLFVVITASATATTPVLTITYTDQNGNTGNTATMTLPSNALINSAFFLQPHLATGDSGIRAVTNMSISTGTAGSLKVYGILPQHFYQNQSALFPYGTDLLSTSIPPILAEPNDNIAIYRYGANTASDVMALLVGTPERT